MKTMTLTYRVPAAEFDAEEFMHDAEVIDMTRMGFYVVIEQYVQSQQHPDRWESRDGVMLDTGFASPENTHLESASF